MSVEKQRLLAPHTKELRRSSSESRALPETRRQSAAGSHDREGSSGMVELTVSGRKAQQQVPAVIQSHFDLVRPRWAPQCSCSTPPFICQPRSEAPFETGLLSRPHTMTYQGMREQIRKFCMPIQAMFMTGHFQQVDRRWRCGPGPSCGDASEPGGFPGAQLLRSCARNL